MHKKFVPILFLILTAASAAAAPVLADEGDKSASAETAKTAASAADSGQYQLAAPLTGFAGTDINLIHSGDKLSIEVYREKDLTGTFTVDSSGKINYPLLGEIYVEGLSRDELKGYLTETLGADYVVNPQVQIEFLESPNKSVAILGQVSKPGNYILTPNSTLVRLISQVGGFTSDASIDNVKIVRTEADGEKKSQLINVGDIMSGKAGDFKLEPGDLIYVQKAPKEKENGLGAIESVVTILGQVNRPGNYPMVPQMTLIRLIAQAGGFTPVASAGNVRVVRHSKDGRETSFSVDAGRIMSGHAEDVKLEAGDLVVVQESLF